MRLLLAGGSNSLDRAASWSLASYGAKLAYGDIQKQRLKIQVQKDVERLDSGASGCVYAVTDDVVLKAPNCYYPIDENTSAEDCYDFYTSTSWYHEDISNERGILRTLEALPHPNIVRPISLDYPEGVYLKRHQPLRSTIASLRPPTNARKRYYRDMLRALLHLHDLKIAHSDVRLDNFLFARDGHVILCDFTCTRVFGEDNPSLTFPSEKLNVNGHYSHVSDITDRFAMGSVIAEIETGVRPALFHDGTNLIIPSIQLDDAQLSLIVQKAWHNKYESTREMLLAMDDLIPQDEIPQKNERVNHLDLSALREQVDQWRKSRLNRYGINAPSLCHITANCTPR